MTRMSDDELDDSYFNGFNANWDGTDTGVSSLTAGLRAVADAAERRVLDRLDTKLNDIVWNPEPFTAIDSWLSEMREELDRGDG
jgi:hypothetical protein